MEDSEKYCVEREREKCGDCTEDDVVGKTNLLACGSADKGASKCYHAKAEGGAWCQGNEGLASFSRSVGSRCQVEEMTVEIVGERLEEEGRRVVMQDAPFAAVRYRIATARDRLIGGSDRHGRACRSVSRK
jgi:hypothetical protein